MEEDGIERVVIERQRLGVLLVIAGLGYLIDGIGPVLSPGYSIELALFTFVGEIVSVVWLLLGGRSVSLASEATSTGRC